MGFTDTTGAKQQQVLAAVHPAGVVGELLDLERPGLFFLCRVLCSDAALPFWGERSAGELVPAASVRDLVLQAAGVPVGGVRS